MLMMSIAVPALAQEDGSTPETAIKITGIDGLKAISNVPAKHYRLMNDIDLNNEEWTPLCNDSNKPFAGSFDGFGYVINGLNVNITKTSTCAGLFGYISEVGTVKNLGVKGTGVTGIYQTGGIAGINFGTIQNCYTGLPVISNTTGTGRAGGIAGNNYGNILNCYTTGAVTNQEYYAGGIAGDNSNINGATIQYCYATGAISGNNAGGITGRIGTGGEILNCIALNSDITGTGNSPATGRITGDKDNGTLTGNHAAPYLPGTWEAADKAADKKNGEDLTTANFIGDAATAFTDWPTNSWYFIGDIAKLPMLVISGVEITGQGPMPARKDYLAKPLITTITNVEDLETFRDAVNGGATYADITVKLTASFSLEDASWTPIGNAAGKPFDGTFDGQGYIISGLDINLNGSGKLYGGLFGYIGAGGTVKNLGVAGTISVISDDNPVYAGGVAGYSAGTISNCYTHIDVTAEGANPSSYRGGGRAGGIAGYTLSSITNCYAQGTITSNKYAGGIAGNEDGGNEEKGSVSNCFATGTVKGSYVGGIAYCITTVQNCIALQTGGITGTSDRHRIVTNGGGSTFTDNYASPGIPGTWEYKGTDRQNGADLTELNFITNPTGDNSAFKGWSADSWDFSDNTRLPKLKTTGLTDNMVIRGQGDADDKMPARTDFLDQAVVIDTKVSYNSNLHDNKDILITGPDGHFTVNSPAFSANFKTVTVSNGGYLTMGESSSSGKHSLGELVVENGGQVFVEAPFLLSRLSTSRTLGNKWMAYGYCLDMKATAADIIQFYQMTGYTAPDDQKWEGRSSSTQTTPLDRLNLLATESDNQAVTLFCKLDDNAPFELPKDATTYPTGSGLNTGTFLFVANPTLHNLTISVAYLLSEDGTRFERTENAVVKPFKAYIVANEVTTKAVMSLRVGDGTPTANTPIALPDGTFRVWSSNGLLHLAADLPAEVAIYNLSGKLVRRITLSGEQTVSLPRGIYLVNNSNITYKVSL